MDYVQEDGSNQNLGEEEKITSKFLSTFGFISLKNPVHKTFNGMLAGLIAELDNHYIIIT